MRNKIFPLRALLLVAMVLLSALTAPHAAAYNNLSPEARTFITKILSRYSLWSQVELNGKLTVPNLPVRPSVRIYMKRGEKVFISVRAPFMGEVGRMELTGDSLLVVNKMRKVYIRESLAGVARHLPVKTEDLQDFFLGRVFLIDYGTLSATNCTMADYSRDPDCWLLIPLSQPADGLVRYGYTIGFDGRIQALYATTDAEMFSALAEYTYSGKKTTIDLSWAYRDKTRGGILSLDEPKWNARPMERIRINRNWRQVSVREFLKSMSF